MAITRLRSGCQFPTSAIRVRALVWSFGIYGGQRGRFSSNTLVSSVLVLPDVPYWSGTINQLVVFLLKAFVLYFSLDIRKVTLIDVATKLLLDNHN
jgi:hypothetical protein